MKHNYIEEMTQRYPALGACAEDVRAAVDTLIECYRAGGKILLCGNGGSAADCEHIAGEFLKGFLSLRPSTEDELASLSEALGDPAKASKLQRGISAIPLPSISGALSAFANDVDAELVYAQLVYALGKQGDVLIAISTSGNSKNAVAAAKVARARGLKTVALTGMKGGSLADVCDVCVKAPEKETYKVQEYHLPIYHAICAQVEDILFEEK